MQVSVDEEKIDKIKNSQSNKELVELCLRLQKNVSEVARSQQILKSSNKELELLYFGEELEKVLEFQCREAELIYPYMHCSVLKLDEEKTHLHHCASNTLPQEYIDAIDGVEIGEGVGSCGTAAFLRQRIVVEDINTHPFWEPFKHLALSAGLQACWSEPIIDSAGEVYGTFAMYYESPRKPTKEDLEYIANQARIASIIFEHKKNQSKLSDQRQALENTVDEQTRKLKQTIKELKHAKELADSANKAKSLFLANMSHEIRTPMNAIIGFSELMLEKKSDSEDGESLDIIHNAALHLLSLINDVLDISKIEAGRMKLSLSDFSFTSLISRVLELVKPQCETKDLALVRPQVHDLPDLLIGDESKVRQVIINLLSNAIKFTDTGKVTVKIDSKVIANSHVEIKVEVEDTGAGIDKDEFDKVFSTFEQTQSGIENDAGTGLGLAISRAYARMMGGDLYFESEKGKGSCFTFLFTAENAAAVTSSSAGSLNLNLEGQKPIILVTDDTLHNCLLVEKILVPLGFEVHVANNGQEAIDRYKQIKPDLVLMDRKMPVMSGDTATRIIKQDDGYTSPVIAMTTSVFAEERQEIMKCGADDILGKPFKRDELIAILAKHLGLKLYTDPAHNKSKKSATKGSETKKENTAINRDKMEHIEGSANVLIVDDNKVNRMLARKLLEKNEHRCTEAENGEQALALIKSHSPAVVLLDLEMPVMDGREVLRTVNELGLDVVPHIIVSTADNDKALERELLALGASAICAKPLDGQKLFAIIEGLAEHH